MCGIAGYRLPDAPYRHEEILRSMIDEIHHRGPDDEGIWIHRGPEQETIGFGHKRLRIVDLSANGVQPMHAASGAATIVFNGEIYDYKILRKQLEEQGATFRTGTDTEVLLHMYERYGTACLEHLNGMFAFAIYDKRLDQLFIARDRLGERPLYYYQTPDAGIVFASEMKALWRHPAVRKTVDYGNLYEYVKKRYVNNPDTLFHGIRKLEPGHYLLCRQGRISNHAYWDIPSFEKLPVTMKQAMSSLDELLQDSIALRMTGDAPMGAFLSGGLDSSLIVAMMARKSAGPVKTFSVGFEDSRFSELPYARQVAELFGTDHHELIIRPEEFRDTISEAASFRDVPLSETADIPLLLLSRMAKKQVDVVLAGEGSDELFAGYPKYAFDHWAHSPWFKLLLKNRPAKHLIDALPYSFRKLKLAYHTLSISSDEERYERWFSSFGDDTAGELFTPDFRQDYGIGRASQAGRTAGITNLDRLQYQDMKYWLTDNLLERGDRMSMAASVEERLPFLDHRIAELAFRLPEPFKVHRLHRKYLIKKVAEQYLPKDIIYRKKIGFYVPVGHWFKKELKDYVIDHLHSASFRQRGLFDYRRVEQMLEAHLKGITNYEKELWVLLNLEVWFRTCIDA